MLRVKYSSQSFIVMDTTSQALTRIHNNQLVKPFEILISILLRQKLAEREKMKNLESLIMIWFIKSGQPQDMAEHFGIITHRQGQLNG